MPLVPGYRILLSLHVAIALSIALFLDTVCSNVRFLTLYFLPQPGQHPKELNPYWKDGGTGLPSERENAQETRQVQGNYTKTNFVLINNSTISSFKISWRKLLIS